MINTDQVNSNTATVEHAPTCKVKKTFPRMAFPQWLKRDIPKVGKKEMTQSCLDKGELHTVCKEARCPNRMECFSQGTATFLLMGDVCTRHCLFCSVSKGTPTPLPSQEPHHICEAVATMGLTYVVLTSVTRDDLPDGGAAHIAQTVRMLKEQNPQINVEVLVPDFQGNKSAIATVLDAKPDVFNHNIETVKSIFPHIRPEANYDLSLEVLRYAAAHQRAMPTKSGFMVGLGESEEEVTGLLEDLYRTQVSIVTIGQYLRPSKEQAAIKEFVSPKQFERYKEVALHMGFSKVFSAPYVRSSYNAASVFTQS